MVFEATKKLKCLQQKYMLCHTGGRGVLFDVFFDGIFSSVQFGIAKFTVQMWRKSILMKGHAIVLRIC